MIKSSRKILKFINDNTSSTKGLAASNIATSFKMDLNYVNDVLDYLYEQELIKIFSKHQTYVLDNHHYDNKYLLLYRLSVNLLRMVCSYFSPILFVDNKFCYVKYFFIKYIIHCIFIACSNLF